MATCRARRTFRARSRPSRKSRAGSIRCATPFIASATPWPPIRSPAAPIASSSRSPRTSTTFVPRPPSGPTSRPSSTRCRRPCANTWIWRGWTLLAGVGRDGTQSVEEAEERAFGSIGRAAARTSGEINRLTNAQIRLWGAREIYVRALVAGTIAVLIGLAVSFRQMLRRARRDAARIEQLAHYDSLTGLPNRSLLEDRLSRLFALAHRNASPMAILLFDLDGFKAVNDALGHGAGDALLVAVAQRARDCVRASDTAGRLGGDEFLVLLPDTDREGALAVALKLLEAHRPAIRPRCRTGLRKCQRRRELPARSREGSRRARPRSRRSAIRIEARGTQPLFRSALRGLPGSYSACENLAQSGRVLGHCLHVGLGHPDGYSRHDRIHPATRCEGPEPAERKVRVLPCQPRILNGYSRTRGTVATRACRNVSLPDATAPDLLAPQGERLVLGRSGFRNLPRKPRGNVSNVLGRKRRGHSGHDRIGSRAGLVRRELGRRGSLRAGRREWDSRARGCCRRCRGRRRMPWRRSVFRARGRAWVQEPERRPDVSDA